GDGDTSLAVVGWAVDPMPGSDAAVLGDVAGESISEWFGDAAMVRLGSDGAGATHRRMHQRSRPDCGGRGQRDRGAELVAGDEHNRTQRPDMPPEGAFPPS